MTKVNKSSEKFNDLLITLFILAAAAAILISPKISEWVYYGADGVIIKGASYRLCEVTARYNGRGYGKCSYASIILGANTGRTTSVPPIPDQFEGVKVEVFKDGRCYVHARAMDKDLFISIEKSRIDPGSARLGNDLNVNIPLVSFEVEHAGQPEHTLSYREPDDFISLGLGPFHGRVNNAYVGRGWYFDKELDQIVRGVPVVRSWQNKKLITYDIQDVFSDRSLVPGYEKNVISMAFAWRDGQLSSFRRQLGLYIPSSCEAARSHVAGTK